VAIRESQASADRGHLGTTCEAAAGGTERPESTTAPEITENADHAPRPTRRSWSRLARCDDIIVVRLPGTRRDAAHWTSGVRVAEQDMSRLLPAQGGQHGE
jgi:hypothetical protein